MIDLFEFSPEYNKRSPEVNTEWLLYIPDSTGIYDLKLIKDLNYYEFVKLKDKMCQIDINEDDKLQYEKYKARKILIIDLNNLTPEKIKEMRAKLNLAESELNKRGDDD